MAKLKQLLPLLLLVVAACDDPFGPQPWLALPDTLTIYSASRAQYVGLGSALDVAADPVTVFPIEIPGATGNWDLTVVDDAGGLALASAASFVGMETSRARIAVIEGQTLAEVEEAPRDTARYSVGPVPLRMGVVYVIRSRKVSCGLASGSRYAKMQPVSIDVARGIYRFAIVRNPFCDDRALIPPDVD